MFIFHSHCLIKQSIRWVLVIAAFITYGCDKQKEQDSQQIPPLGFYGPNFWFRNLSSNFAKWTSNYYTIAQVESLTPVTAEQYRQMVSILSSFYTASNLSFSSDGSYNTLSQKDAAEVYVIETSWVADFARRGWLAPFDESLTNVLLEAGVAPIRVAGTPDTTQTQPFIYGIPITREADFIAYRKSRFSDDSKKVQDLWIESVLSNNLPAGRILLGGTELYRFFLGLVWSTEPLWPFNENGAYAVDSPAAHTALSILLNASFFENSLSATRMQQMDHMRKCIDVFSTSLSDAPSGLSVSNTAMWMLTSSSWALRMLTSPWSQQQIPLDDIGLLPLGISTNRSGYSLCGGKCLIMSRRMLADDHDIHALRSAINLFVEYLLSFDAQRALCLSPFEIEIPVRQGVLSAITCEDMASVFSSIRRRTDSSDVRTNDIDQAGKMLTFLKQINTVLDDHSSTTILCNNPLSLHESFLVEQMLTQALTSRTTEPEIFLNPEITENAVSEDSLLRQLQERLETATRFFSPGNCDHNGK